VAFLLAVACSGSRERRAAEVQALLDDGRLRDALASAEGLRRDFPDALAGWLLGARAYEHEDRRRESCALYREAYELHPDGFPALPELVLDCSLAHPELLGGPDDAVRALLAEAAAREPSTPGLLEARIVALTTLLNRESGGTAADEEELTALVGDLHAQGAHGRQSAFILAEALVLLGRTAEALAVMEAELGGEAPGMATGEADWDRMTMRMACAFLRLHQGEDRAAQEGLARWAEEHAAWRGLHFGMVKPVVLFAQLTGEVRFGKRPPAPAGDAERRAAAEREGVALEVGTNEARAALAEVFAAEDRGDLVAARSALQDLYVLLGRDHGCVMENAVIRPHVQSMALMLNGDILHRLGDTAGAAESYQAAAALFPGDPWLAAKATALR
jgi:tetratricopeptide (TPR) repeat protein